MTASDIIKRLGGATAVHEALGVPRTTIYSWARWNQIPQWRQPKLLELAATTGEPLSTTDFPGPDERIKPEAMAA